MIFLKVRFDVCCSSQEYYFSNPFTQYLKGKGDQIVLINLNFLSECIFYLISVAKLWIKVFHFLILTSFSINFGHTQHV